MRDLGKLYCRKICSLLFFLYFCNQEYKSKILWVHI